MDDKADYGSHDRSGTGAPELEETAEQLITAIKAHGRVAVTLSGGVDSAVVTRAAGLALGSNAIAVTAVSSSLPEGELELARELAHLCNVEHRLLETREFENPEYTQNPANRCFFCKTELYSRLWTRRDEWGFRVILNGANQDDLGDHRPGMLAATNYQVRSPLLECGITKATVRALARYWQLPVWDKPAAPCLSSRIAYGVEVTPERVRRIDSAERWLRETLGVRELRVRTDANDHARVELPQSEIATACDAAMHERIVDALTALGFHGVSIDPRGFRSGSLNETLSPGALVPLTTLSPR